jgi:hypothetical protein
VLLVGGIGAIVLFALGLVAYGYYADRVAPRGATVLVIGDRSFDYAYLEKRSQAALADGSITIGSSEDITLGVVQTLDKIEREELVRRAAAAAGISATQQEVDEEMRKRLRAPLEASREEFAPVLRQELLRLGLSVGEYEAIVEAEVLEEKLREQRREAVPAQLEHADLRLIQLPSEEKANEAKSRLEAGESAAAVAAGMSVPS